VKGPIGSFARSVRTPWNFDETVIEAEVVPERVLPTLSVFAIVRKVIHDKFVDV